MSGKAGSKLTLTRLLKFIYLLTSSSTRQMLIRSATFCKKDYIHRLALFSFSVPLCHTILVESWKSPPSIVLTENWTDYWSIPNCNNLKELRKIVFFSPRFWKSTNNFLHFPCPKKDFQKWNMGEDRAGQELCWVSKHILSRHKRQIPQPVHCVCVSLPSPLPGCAEVQKSPLHMPNMALKAFLFP